MRASTMRAGALLARSSALLLVLAGCDATDTGAPFLDESLATEVDELAAERPTDPPIEPPGNLSGELVLIEQHGPPDFRVATFDLATHEVSTLFTLPEGAFAYGLDVHPTTGAVLLAYTEPPAADEPGFDRSVLVTLDEHGPHHLLGEDLAGHWALWPRWSAAGDDVWYVVQDSTDVDAPSSTLVRADPETGAIEVEIPWATEPAVSPAGDYVAWVALDPETLQRSVVLATAAGDPVRTMVYAGDVYDLGLPTFFADGRGVLVSVLADPLTPRSAELPLQAPLSSQAHGVHLSPADWYGIAVDDTALVPVSTLSTIQYAATVSLDDPVLVAATREGLDLVRLEGGTSERLLSNRFIRAAAWRPSA